LSEVGVRVDSESVLELLEKNGAAVDYEDYRARISEEMVNAALETAPEKITLCGRDPANDLELPVSSYPYSVTNGTAVFILDNNTGEYRHSTARDVADIQKLADGLDGIDFLWPTLSATDKPAQSQTLYEIWISLENSSKHYQGDALHGAHNARAQIELAALIVGGREELKKRPIISMIVCPLAPLSFERGAIESQVEFARAGVPIVSLSMSIGGLSTPITVSGMMLSANAENLASLVITQAAEAGAPHIYGSDSSPMDLMTGGINYGAPEFGMSDYLSTCFSSACHTDLTGGLGSIDDAKGICFKQLLIDAYTWECCREYLKPIEITEERLGLDAIKDIGPRGNFLTHPHTLEYLRNELIFWDEEKYALLAMNKDEQTEKARELVNKILEEHQATPLGESIVRTGYEMIKAYEQKYAK
jgi:trimethylamine--corrinoid protein Co-methyltransferase